MHLKQWEKCRNAPEIVQENQLQKGNISLPRDKGELEKRAHQKKCKNEDRHVKKLKDKSYFIYANKRGIMSKWITLCNYLHLPDIKDNQCSIALKLK